MSIRSKQRTVHICRSLWPSRIKSVLEAFILRELVLNQLCTDFNVFCRRILSWSRLSLSGGELSRVCHPRNKRDGHEKESTEHGGRLQLRWRVSVQELTPVVPQTSLVGSHSHPEPSVLDRWDSYGTSERECRTRLISSGGRRDRRYQMLC